MIKKLMVTVLLLTAFPLMANAAWMFNTQAKNAGGTIDSPKLAGQTVASGNVFKTYTTHLQPQAVTVTANAGYTISNIVLNGATILNPASPYATTVNGGAAASTNNSLFATFQARQLTVTASTGAGGSVNLAGLSNIYYGTTLTAAKSFTFTPRPSTYTVAGIGGVPAGATVSPALPVAAGMPVTVTLPVGFTFNSNIALYGSFAGPPVAKTEPSQVVMNGTATTLDGSPSTGIIGSYNWTQTSGPGFPASKVIADNTPGVQTTFTPAVAGTYVFRLTVTGGSTASTTVIVTDSLADAVRNQCQNCHSGNGIGTDQNFVNWSSSRHRAGGVTCSQCHIGSNTGAHPGYAPANICSTCHNTSSHPVYIGANPCISCHNAHSLAATMDGAPHYNNITGGMYPASYVTSRPTSSNCQDCHADGAANASARQQWAQSGHAKTTALPWINYDFKTRSGCVQCHTTTGFIAYSTAKVTAAWGSTSDKTKEVLTCVGCHSDVAAGTVRTFTPNKPYADDSYTNLDVGKSNICMDCHSGRNNGKSIAKLAVQANITSQFISSHYMAAGGTLHGRVGYHFPGQTYAFYSSNTHRKVGMADSYGTGTAGPCVSCHMSSGSKHSFSPVSRDQNGAITAITSSNCANCHSTFITPASLTAGKTDVTNALDVLKAQLAASGHPYSPNYPYFSAGSWGAGQAGANIMGAAFNYVLLLREPGVYAHNSAYAKKLIFDSIDALYNNGSLTGSIDAALDALYNYGNGTISQAAYDSMKAYKNKTSCNACHGGTTASGFPIATNAHPGHLTSQYGPGNFLGNDVNACQACHVYNDTQHMNTVVDVRNGAGSACANCHSGNVPAWGGTARLACTSCHSANPAVLPNGTAAPYKANFASSGHGRFAASNQCTVCHDPDSPHISGSLGTYVRLRLSNNNDQCGSCHNGTTARAMSSHVLDKSGTSNPSLCKECHDAHGTSNLHMIKTVINGKSIAFTNTSTGFVKLVAPFDGLCQACHTLTTHYRSGQAPDDHPTKNCLNCHSHTAAFAFKPAGSCDSCHGYPPVPAGFVGSQGNYTSARVEDYLGGSGAHTTESHIKKTARASEGWANCTTCHGDGSLNPATHTMNMPVTPSKITIDVDNRFKFNASLPLGPGQYSGLLLDGGANATGTCSNVKCHFQPTTKWSAFK